MTETSWFKINQKNSAITLSIYIQPNAKQDEITGLFNHALKIKLAAPAIDGKANARLIDYLAKMLSLSKQNFIIKQGLKSRCKLIEINVPPLLAEPLLSKIALLL